MGTRRADREAEGARLLSEYGSDAIWGSNPQLSASQRRAPTTRGVFLSVRRRERTFWETSARRVGPRRHARRSEPAVARVPEASGTGTLRTGRAFQRGLCTVPAATCVQTPLRTGSLVYKVARAEKPSVQSPVQTGSLVYKAGRALVGVVEPPRFGRDFSVSAGNVG